MAEGSEGVPGKRLKTTQRLRIAAHGGISNETRSGWARSELEPAQASEPEGYDLESKFHEDWLSRNTPDLRGDIAAARANPGESFRTVDWANDPRYVHIQQVRNDLIAAANEPSDVPRYLRPEYIRTSGLHEGAQIRFGHIHLTYDGGAGSVLVPRIHWDTIDPVRSILGHAIVDVAPTLWR